MKSKGAGALTGAASFDSFLGVVRQLAANPLSADPSDASDAATLTLLYDDLLHRFYDVSTSFEHLVDTLATEIPPDWWDQNSDQADQLRSLASHFEALRTELLISEEIAPDEIASGIDQLRIDLDGLGELLLRFQTANEDHVSSRDPPPTFLEKALRTLGLKAGVLPAVKELRKAWVAALRQWHPDIGPDSERGIRTSRTQEINFAYEFLLAKCT